MVDAVDELIQHRRQQGKLSASLRRVYRFHKANRQVLDFIVAELQTVKANGRTRASIGSLWHYARWVLEDMQRNPGETFVMPNGFFPWYGRLVCILHPDLCGFCEMAKSRADADLGLVLEPPTKSHERGYIRRLTWADGTPLSSGWRPTTPHMPKPVKRRAPIRRRDS